MTLVWLSQNRKHIALFFARIIQDVNNRLQFLEVRHESINFRIKTD